MLESLMRLLARREPVSFDELAAQLSVSRELLEQMLQDLARGGYLEEMPVVCGRTCEGCESAGLCAVMRGGRIWRVTAKGSRLIGDRGLSAPGD